MSMSMSIVQWRHELFTFVTLSQIKMNAFQQLQKFNSSQGGRGGRVQKFASVLVTSQYLCAASRKYYIIPDLNGYLQHTNVPYTTKNIEFNRI